MLVNCNTNLFADVDECAGINPCGPNTVCTNNIGSYACSCLLGYTKDDVGCTGTFLTEDFFSENQVKSQQLISPPSIPWLIVD